VYESGARSEEFLRLTNMKVDSKGAVLILRGKTGEKRIGINLLSSYYNNGCRYMM